MIRSALGHGVMRNALVVCASIAALGATPAIASQGGGGKGKHNSSNNGNGSKGKHNGGGQNSFRGFVYTQTNDPAGNAVVVFKRKSDGTITQFQTIKTGGVGTASQQPFGLPQIDAADSVELTSDGRLLFVVNAGDNTITSFRVTASGLKRADIESSGGVLPVSIAMHGKLLYVMDTVTGNIAGFHFSSSGKLTSIVHSVQPLSVVGPNGVGASLVFTPDGHMLVATLRDPPPVMNMNGTPGLIDTFPIAADGSAGPAVQTTAAAPTPFALWFTPSGVLLDASAGVINTPNNAPPPLTDGTKANGSVQSYSVGSNGTVTPISNAPSGGRATCWVIATPDGKWAYSTNTLSSVAANPAPGDPLGTGVAALTVYSVTPSGQLKQLETVNTGPGFPADMAFSHDGKFLYVTNATLGFVPVPGSHIEVYAVNDADGSLTHVQATPFSLPKGIAGMAAF
jgi:6-phosphogluconolactonase (cycloisomerase 2 family)